MNNGINHRDKADKADDRCHFDTHGTEDVLIKRSLIRSCTTHQNETDDNNQHTDSQQDKIELVEGKIFSHELSDYIYTLNLVQLSCFHLQELVNGDIRTERCDEYAEEEDNCCGNRQYLPVQHIKYFGLIVIQGIDERPTYGTGNERGNDTHPKGLHDKGTADESPRGTD
jgi:hypothetical protein